MTPQTTIDQVTVSAQLRVVDAMQVAWPNPVDLSTLCTHLVSTYRQGDDPRTLEFSLDQLKAICKKQGRRHAWAEIAINLIPIPQLEHEQCCQRKMVISTVDQGAQLVVTFNNHHAGTPVAKEEALQFAKELIDALHIRM